MYRLFILYSPAFTRVSDYLFTYTIMCLGSGFRGYFCI
nr:MAG TPA: hypothetical protein [Caudoviricetes sp.]DAN27596.1 MAG TPA: hypothetical protein [Caudoviricetes sp.]